MHIGKVNKEFRHPSLANLMEFTGIPSLTNINLLLPPPSTFSTSAMLFLISPFHFSAKIADLTKTIITHYLNI